MQPVDGPAGESGAFALPRAIDLCVKSRFVVSKGVAGDGGKSCLK